MPDISSIRLPSGTSIDLKDATARSAITTATSTLAPKASPVFTGSITLGSTAMTEAQLSNLLNLTSANGQSF